MLIYNIPFSSLSDHHLLNIVDLKTNLTDLELELSKRLAQVVDNESAEEVKQRLHKEYESIEEQSEFRRQLIEDILNHIESLCPRYKETKELIDHIKTELDESYVEL